MQFVQYLHGVILIAKTECSDIFSSYLIVLKYFTETEGLSIACKFPYTTAAYMVISIFFKFYMDIL